VDLRGFVCWLIVVSTAGACSTTDPARSSDAPHPTEASGDDSAPDTPTDVIYETDAYTIESNRLTQGNTEVIAESPERLVRMRPDASDAWEASRDVSQFPSYTSDQPLVDALYRMSLEELLLDIREDGALMAGKKWEGIWTRDISYAALLSLALLAPEATEKSLRAKVDDGRIVQDTGTGGSWPVSTDRVTWALAAWELYTVTGDREWLEDAYGIIERSVRADLENVYDERYGLFRGESSFLDWREQSYPSWMSPRDIYVSLNLATNAVYARTFDILAEMAERLDNPHETWRDLADRTAEAIDDHLWQPERGYYAQYLYGRHHLRRSPRSETLGASLTILFDVASEQRARTMTESLPTLVWGPPCFYPQISEIPSYHNDGIWPFVVSYWTWASAEAGNVLSVQHGLGSLYRASALFLTNKENMVASTGRPEGTELNSDRQLWSVAGNLATVYRVFFGMTPTPEAIELDPLVPRPYGGTRRIEGLAYRGATWTVELVGYGTEVASVTRDGEPVEKPRMPADLEGEHSLTIELAGRPDRRDDVAVELTDPNLDDDGDETSSETDDDSRGINLVDNRFSPNTPEVTLEGETLEWSAVDGADEYAVLENGREVVTRGETSHEVSDPGPFAEYQVVAVGDEGTRSFASEPVTRAEDIVRVPADPEQNAGDGDASSGWTELTSEVGDRLELEVDVPNDGTYLVDVHYANGHGPIDTDNKCAIRTLHVDGEAAGPVVMPQRGDEAWDDFGYSNAVQTPLESGTHTLALVYEPEDVNMNHEVNSARVDHIRLTRFGD